MTSLAALGMSWVNTADHIFVPLSASLLDTSVGIDVFVGTVTNDSSFAVLG